MGQCTLHNAEFLCLQLTIQNYDLGLTIDVFVFHSLVGTTVNIPLNLKYKDIYRGAGTLVSVI